MSKTYYLGLDIGTDSVGYAVTDEHYQLQKKRGEPVWGATTFEAAALAQERRTFRTARRRVDRRQHRVELLNEIFASDIGKIDPKFFVRRAESRLYRDETEDEYTVFNDKDFTDKEYHKRYPTIHHLINDLMVNENPHDIRLVYIACAWLVAHRGHFLFDVPAEEVGRLLNFNEVYRTFEEYLADNGWTLPWSSSVSADDILNIIRRNTGIRRKQDAFKENIFGGKKPSKETDEVFPFNREAIVTLLCGGKVKPEEIFRNEAYGEVESISLNMDEENFSRILAELGDDGEVLLKLRAMSDCALLIANQNGKQTVSEAKIAIYDQHKQDLKNLKKFVKKYIPQQYNAIFRNAESDNYVAFSGNVKSCNDAKKVKGSSAEKFSKYLQGKIKGISPEEADLAFYNDMLARLETNTFLPKQKSTDNRVIPQQLYRYELASLLDKAEVYTPLLRRKDDSGLTAKEKILSIFDFRIPYFVGPLNRNSKHAWFERKAEGKIYPWNFSSLVDFDRSEQAFIQRMTNTCTYLPGEDVLPIKSLLYCRYTVLNEINNLKINGNNIPVDVKQNIYNELFMKYAHVTLKQINTYLRQNGLLKNEDTLSGVDIKINASLSSYHQFKRLLSSGILEEKQVEDIINRAAYSEDRSRFLNWLAEKYPQISEADRKYIARLNLKEFGRLSARFLVGINGVDKNTGEVLTIMDGLWNSNNNLMQLLSTRFSFREEIENYAHSYYEEHPVSLSKRLDEMYISNAVKRPIIRTLDICTDVVKAMDGAPTKIFIEIARGSTPDQKGKRTQTRKQQLLDLYKQIKTADARALEKELDEMGVMADNRLQSEALFLYYLQMGKCAYTGHPIDITRLTDGTYNIDHIWPQAYIKDDSILNNKVLVDSRVNGLKTNSYPVSADIQRAMRSTWFAWKENKLMTEEKYQRLIRTTGFTDEEKLAFINRQLVETRQSTKAVAELLKERYPDTEIVYVKAGMVSEFRQEFEMLKCRSVNNIHHAKDAYLNIVVGNVYNSRFTKNFYLNQEYSVKLRTLFTHDVKCGKTVVWQHNTDLAKVRDTMSKNAVHLTRYSFCRKGGLFDQQPVKAAEGLISLKKNLPTEKYGGYNKATASFYSLVKYTTGKKTDILLMPVELRIAERYLQDNAFAAQYAKETINNITGKEAERIEFLLGGRQIKINTEFSFDGLHMVLNGKSSGGRQVLVMLNTPLVLGDKSEKYIKSIERFQEKIVSNPQLQLCSEYDHITTEQNIALYDQLSKKMSETIFRKCPGNQAETLKKGRDSFCKLEIKLQIACLMNIVGLMNAVPASFDLSYIGGSKNAGGKLLSSSLSNWKKNYSDVRIIDKSASGIYEDMSYNLLTLL